MTEAAPIDRAVERLAAHRSVVAVYAFGSLARGDAGPGSDVDLAVLVQRSLSLREELKLRAEVVETLRRDDVDLVVLTQAPPLLRYEVIATGERLFARDGAAADRFEECAIRECFDTAHLRAVQQRLGREAMTLRPEVIRQRLGKLREILRNLEAIRHLPLAELVSSYRHYWVAERGLQLAAETTFDIGNHLLAGHFNVHATDYEDVLERMATQGVLSVETREAMRGLGGFRNVLVHAYLDIDEERVHRFLQEGLGDFEVFARQVEAFIAELDS